MEYKIVNDFEEIKVLLKDIFTEISMRKRMKEVLQNFSLKKGCVVERKAICFRADLDEYDLSQLKIPLDNFHVLIEVDAIASSINQNSQAYLTFLEFYEYLEKNIENYVVVDSQISELLLNLKIGLQI